jgi:hypothetical protein
MTAAARPVRRRLRKTAASDRAFEPLHSCRAAPIDGFEARLVPRYHLPLGRGLILVRSRAGKFMYGMVSGAACGSAPIRGLERPAHQSLALRDTAVDLALQTDWVHHGPTSSITRTGRGVSFDHLIDAVVRTDIAPTRRTNHSVNRHTNAPVRSAITAPVNPPQDTQFLYENYFQRSQNR